MAGLGRPDIACPVASPGLGGRSLDIRQAGEAAARARLKQFAAASVAADPDSRDRRDQDGNSRLSRACISVKSARAK
jgi:deoxyribodipyrimidine photolyase